jgi:hypothetical protein
VLQLRIDQHERGLKLTLQQWLASLPGLLATAAWAGLLQQQQQQKQQGLQVQVHVALQFVDAGSGAVLEGPGECSVRVNPKDSPLMVR